MKKTIYTIATAHLDTSWLWTQETTVRDYLPETLRKNFALFEKYPEYKFNFEGSYRYELMEEYYPEEFERLKKYIALGKWNVTGSCYENGDVNIPSPEALIRNIIYGNGYFREKFGRESNDIFLPDCFGFGRALPSVAAHCGLTGFSTQKLSWGSAEGVPFDIGRWVGNDGRGVWCAIAPGSYNTVFGKVRSGEAKKNLSENGRHGCNVTMRYHGTGDRGGSPHESSVKAVVKAARRNAGEDIDVVSASTYEFFETLEAMPEKVKAEMPVWNKEFLMTEHGTGSYTTRTLTKRWNKQSEALADCAERAAVLAMLTGESEYPSQMLDFAWKKTIQHHFHDDITGTSFQQCYKRSFNDYMLAMNTSVREYTNAARSLCAATDTSFVQGIPVFVFNPTQNVTVKTVSVKLPSTEDSFFRVYGRSGKEMPSQLSGGSVLFSAKLPSNGFDVFDIRKSDSPYGEDGSLSVCKNRLENEKYTVKLNASLDIESIYDKKLKREILSSPIRLALIRDENSVMWPAWELKYKDIMKAPFAYPSVGTVKVKESGAVRVSLEIERHYGGSVYRQIISLSKDSETVDVFNEVDWRQEAADLKVSFPFACKNDLACYDIGIGSFKRGVNTKKQFEVPAQRWADITDTNGAFGVSVLSDSRTGWDMPKKNELRLTAIHTPLINHRFECSQHLADMGINRFSFAIFSHSGAPENTPAAAEDFVKAPCAFITDKHDGRLKNSLSLCSVSDNNVRITGIKKAQRSDEIILRAVEYNGAERKNVEVIFPYPVKSAKAVRGDEAVLDGIPVCDGKLVFDMDKNEIKSFALTFDMPETEKASEPLEIPCNAVAITSAKKKAVSNLRGGFSVPGELVPESILTGGVRYAFGKGELNAVICRGQKILTGNEKLVGLLVCSLCGDTEVSFGKEKVTVFDAFEPLARWDMIGLGETGYIKSARQAVSFTHTHKNGIDEIGKQFNLFEVRIHPENGSVILPDNENIVVFAASGIKKDCDFSVGRDLTDTLEKRPFDYVLSDYAKRKSREPAFQRLLDKAVDRVNVKRFKLFNQCMAQSAADIYYLFTVAGNYVGNTVRKLQKNK